MTRIPEETSLLTVPIRVLSMQGKPAWTLQQQTTTVWKTHKKWAILGQSLWHPQLSSQPRASMNCQTCEQRRLWMVPAPSLWVTMGDAKWSRDKLSCWALPRLQICEQNKWCCFNTQFWGGWLYSNRRGEWHTKLRTLGNQDSNLGSVNKGYVANLRAEQLSQAARRRKNISYDLSTLCCIETVKRERMGHGEGGIKLLLNTQDPS